MPKADILNIAWIDHVSTPWVENPTVIFWTHMIFGERVCRPSRITGLYARHGRIRAFPAFNIF